jgi:hypothetical protein
MALKNDLRVLVNLEHLLAHRVLDFTPIFLFEIVYHRERTRIDRELQRNVVKGHRYKRDFALKPPDTNHRIVAKSRKQSFCKRLYGKRAGSGVETIMLASANRFGSHSYAFFLSAAEPNFLLHCRHLNVAADVMHLTDHAHCDHSDRDAANKF